MRRKTELFWLKPGRILLTPLVQESRVAGEFNEVVLTLKVYVRKTDRAILYAECREDFVDFLFTFLAIPLEFAGEFSIDNANMGCVGNLCRSVKGLSFAKQKEAIASKCILPHYYNPRAQLVDIIIQEAPEFEYLVSNYGYTNNKFCKKIKKTVLAEGERIAKFVLVDSKPDCASIGFVKGDTNFIVSDNLCITRMNSTSTISMLSKLQMNINDIEEQVISIGKAEATSLLKASLTNGLSNFLSNMKPEEAIQSASKIQKSEKIL